MKIGIVGAGDIGKLYARLWNRAGHEILLSSRNPEKLTVVAEEIGAGVRVGSVAQAARFGDVVLLAVNYTTIGEAIESIRPHVQDKLVIDATNPLRLKEGGGTERVIGEGEIAGLVMARMLPEARIAKAFTTLWTGHVERHAGVSDPKIAMALAADHEKDRRVVAELIRHAGLEPVDLGSLAESRPLDPPSPIWNVLLSARELEESVAAFRRTEAG